MRDLLPNECTLQQAHHLIVKLKIPPRTYATANVMYSLLYSPFFVPRNRPLLTVRRVRLLTPASAASFISTCHAAEIYSVDSDDDE